MLSNNINKIIAIVIVFLCLTIAFLYQRQNIQTLKIEALNKQNNDLIIEIKKQSNSLKDFKKDIEANFLIIENFNKKDEEIENKIKDINVKIKSLNISQQLKENPKKFNNVVNEHIKKEIIELNGVFKWSIL